MYGRVLASNNRVLEGCGAGELRGIKMTRFSLAVVIALVGISVSALAQQNGTFKVKHSVPEKAPKKAVPISNAPVGKTTGAASSSTANARDLQALEHQTAKASASSRPAGKKAGTASALKPIKDKPNPPINYGGTGGGKSQAGSHAVPDPAKGRLRQKHSHQ